MRRLLLALALAALAAPAAAHDLIGEYRLAEGPDVGGGLLITADGRFRYGLAAGALDEFSEGRWRAEGERICLITEPKPVPPAFARAELVAIEGVVPTILVTWPNGEAVSGVDFVMGSTAAIPPRAIPSITAGACPTASSASRAGSRYTSRSTTSAHRVSNWPRRTRDGCMCSSFPTTSDWST